MRRLLILSTAGLLLGAAGLAAEGWLQDLELAKKEARSGDKDLFLDFTGSDWCVYCMQLDEEVLSTEPFSSRIGDEFVTVMLDYPRDASKVTDEIREQNQRLKGLYRISGYPTVILADADGRPYAETGYQEGGPEKYLEHLAQLRRSKTRFDAEMAKASAARGAGRARLIDQALGQVPDRLLLPFYEDEVAEIIELDGSSELGIKYQRLLEAVQSTRVREDVEAAFETRSEAGEWAELVQDMDRFLKLELADRELEQQVLYFKGLAQLELGELARGAKTLERALGLATDSDLAPRLGLLLEQVRSELGG